jgi:hypothetical protein
MIKGLEENIISITGIKLKETSMRHVIFVPKNEVLSYVLNHPNEFDSQYVAMLRKFAQDKLEKIEDYMVEDKII